MLTIRKPAPPRSGTGLPNRARQAGATLMETMISLALSVLVITGMVILMGNSMGTANRITQSAQLNDQLRNVMSMMTRDVRRANYSAASVLCYGNPYCAQQVATLQDGGDTPLGAHMIIQPSCLAFQVDRPVREDGALTIDGNATNNSKSGFRLVDDDGVGVIEMWVDEEAAVPDCDAENDNRWVPVTDPNIVNIVDFSINDSLSVEKSVFQDDGETEYTQRQRYLQLAVEGELVLEQRMGWVAGDNDIMVRRRVEDIITVRNDYLWPPEPVAP
jgi:prepilin peptidase dependent protein B